MSYAADQPLPINVEAIELGIAELRRLHSRETEAMRGLMECPADELLDAFSEPGKRIGILRMRGIIADQDERNRLAFETSETLLAMLKDLTQACELLRLVIVERDKRIAQLEGRNG